ncbi:MAG TPA: dihydroorotate dehydrogenase-like protein [Bacteroidales bacterium]|nr:dihydroorotate dehydrogenase-like protein [Bacteroidales bacterium]HPE23893.1 dihydroorotate dehydrogenase-like protein [Bacteroidales bacterium]HPJ06198.1 dihydroorotate dehydrogenase-like protein [Bacteroidales bacterium]HPQ65028.1 dihydroorotate dehydrogenase-like protein [Bacteroidales bacterium]HRW28004.1 dihydroorotate dehydrogenase-like protein [Bacteroidales bacterium]
MADLRTRYMGIELKNPIIAGASNMSTDLHKLRQLEEAGVAAIVYKSLFEEQVQLENLELYELKTEYEHRHAEQVTLFPNSESVPESPDDYLLNLRKARETVTVPLFASLNAISDEVWVEYAVKAAATGVDGLELNFYSLPDESGIDRLTIEKRQIDTLSKVKAAVKMPVAVKLTPYYTNTLKFISELDKAGADAVVIFNRLLQPDIDIFEEKHTMPYNLSNGEDNKLPLRFTGMLHGNVKASVCSSTGIYSANDVIKMILGGADAVQVVSTLYRNGIEVIKSMTEEIGKWMDGHGYADLGSFRGKLSMRKLESKLPYTRAQYIDFMMNSGDVMKKYRALS